MWKGWFFEVSPETQASRTSANEEVLADYIYSKVIYQAGNLTVIYSSSICPICVVIFTFFNIYFSHKGVDFESKPMVILCACNLPNPLEVDYDKILS